jgi:hypothetical protein
VIVQLGLPFAALAPPAVSPIAPTHAGSIAPVDPRSLAPATVSSLAPFYFVRHRRARRYLLRVDDDGRVRITIPRGGSRRGADAFLHRHTGWIARQRTRLEARIRLPDEDRERSRRRAAVELPARVRELAAAHGVRITKITIRNQRTRWGSCGANGHLSLNWRLVVMPAWVRDYVIIHELMHVRCPDHSPAYWRLVAEACAYHQEARQWLRRYGPSLR